MIKIDKFFKSEDEKLNFIEECELNFENQLEDLTIQILSDGSLKIITLAGPTCSGKTTTAKKLINDLILSDKSVHLISIDDFFKDRDVLNSSKKIDYDTINAIDYEYLHDCVKDILNDKSVNLPYYDFTNGKRIRYSVLKPDCRDIIIFEGIQAIYPEITKLFGDYLYKSIYINVIDDIEFNGEVFTKRDIRLMRRIVRDYKFRNASPEFTFYLWESVVKNENENIIPYEDNSEYKINSLLLYEVCILKKPICAILETVKNTSPYYQKCMDIKNKFKNIQEINEKYVPENSIYKEFLG